MGRYELIDKKKSSWIIPTMLIILLVGLGIIYVFIQSQDTANTENNSSEQFIEILEVPSKQNSPEKNTDADQEQPTQSEQLTENTDKQESLPLPSLENSDTLFRKDLSKLSPGLTAWLGTNNLIQKLLVITNDFSQGQRIYKHFRFFKIRKPFIAKESAQGFYMARESYQRYDQLAAAIHTIDVKQSIALYQKFRPLFQQVFTEFGYPDSYQLDDIFIKAAMHIIAAPLINDQIKLVHTTVRYKYADPDLEALDAVQKQMLRMGPKNTRIIQNKIRLLLEAMAKAEKS